MGRFHSVLWLSVPAFSFSGTVFQKNIPVPLAVVGKGYLAKGSGLGRELEVQRLTQLSDHPAVFLASTLLNTWCLESKPCWASAKSVGPLLHDDLLWRHLGSKWLHSTRSRLILPSTGHVQSQRVLLNPGIWVCIFISCSHYLGSIWGRRRGQKYFPSSWKSKVFFPSLSISLVFGGDLCHSVRSGRKRWVLRRLMHLRRVVVS